MRYASGNTTGQGAEIPKEWGAFCSFIEAQYRLIYTVALAHVRDGEVAEEITQDICVRLLLEREKLPRMVNAPGWLARVARNTAIDWVRRRQTHSRIHKMMESWNQNPGAANHEPVDARKAAIMEEEKQRLWAALEQVAPEDREMLLMHYLDGVEKQDIARLLEMHPSTVGRRIDKSLRLMKKSLTDFQPASLQKLRPTQHSSKGVLVTLTAVAALGAAEKAALAAVLAPLPVLSAGAGVGAAAISKSGVGASIADAMSGWFVPVVTGVAVLVGVLTYSGYFPFNKSNSSTTSARKIAGIQSEASDPSHPPTLRTISADKVRSKQNASPMMKGLTSVGAYSPGYLPAGVTDGKTLHGTVTDEKRKAISGAKVTIWIPVRAGDDQDRETSHTVTSDAEGKFEFQDLPADTASGTMTYAEVTATADGYAHATRGEYDVVLPLPTVSIDMQIVMARPVTMQGVIINERGEPVPSAKVKVLTEFDANKQHYQEDGFNDDIFVTDADSAGAFSFHKLKPGYVALAVEHPDYAPQLSEALPSDSKRVVLGINKGVSVVGTVYDGATTMSGAAVKFSGTFKGTGSGPDKTVTTDNNGRFEATCLPVYGIDFENQRLPVSRKDHPAWDYNINVGKNLGETTFSADADGLLYVSGGGIAETFFPVYSVTLYRGESTRTLEINSKDPRAAVESDGRYRVRLTGQIPRELPVQTASGATLHGTIVTPEGFTSETRVNVSVRRGREFQQLVPVQNGRFELRGIPPGTYKISGKTADVEPGALYTLFGPQDVTVRDGELHTLELHPGRGGVRGRVTGSLGAMPAKVQVVTVDPLSPWYEGKGVIGEQTVSADGSFEFRGLVPGDYHLVAVLDSQVKNVLFTSIEDQIAVCNIALPVPLKITGLVIDSATSEPVSGVTLSFLRLHDAVGKITSRVFQAKTKADGTYSLGLTTGTYSLGVKPLEQSLHHMMVDVEEGKTQLPAIEVNPQVGGVMVTRPGGAADDVMWRQAHFGLVNLDTGGLGPVIHSNYFLDDQTAILQNIPVGKYGLGVICSTFGGNTTGLFATTYFSDLEVKPDSFAVVVMPLEKGIPVKLSYQPGNQGAGWKQLEFRLKDPSGVSIPIPLSYELGHELLMGLAPGSYELGVTMDSSEEQSVDFEVAPGEKEKEVVLRLR